MCHFHQLIDYNIKRSCQNNQSHGPSRTFSWQKDQSSRANWAPKPSLVDTSCIRTKPSTVQSPLGLLSIFQDKETALNNPCWTSKQACLSDSIHWMDLHRWVLAIGTLQSPSLLPPAHVRLVTKDAKRHRKPRFSLVQLHSHPLELVATSLGVVVVSTRACCHHQSSGAWGLLEKLG